MSDFEFHRANLFPADLVDKNGVRIELGSMVMAHVGEHAETHDLGEVARWVGKRGVEVIFTEPVPDLVAFQPEELEVWDLPSLNPIVEKYDD